MSFHLHVLLLKYQMELREERQMPYKMDVTVPRITPALLAEFEAKAPGLSGLVKIPLISRPHEAARAAETDANKKLPGYEYVSSVETVTETATGWVVWLRIAGD